MNTDDDLLPLSALNDLLFCPRRCALHRLEQVWVENVFTLEGSLAHKKVHADPADEDLGLQGRVVRTLPLRSRRLRLVGVADLVEFRPGPDRTEVPYPVEYKRGKKRKWDNDDVQLCAQALCLEEMLSVPVPAGAVFHVRSKRRREVAFDVALRRHAEDAVARLHALIAAGRTPPPIVHPKCKHCSLYAVCMPELIANQPGYARKIRSLFVVDPPSN